MTSEIRTNSLKSRAGLSTVTMTDSGPMFSGITTFVDNSGFTFGVGGGTSIFTPATNVLTLGTNNTEKIRIDASGHMHGVGVITATHFYGDGSNLTGISAGTSLSGSTNNTVCTVTGANAIQGEANLTFDGNDLTITGTAPCVNLTDTDSDDYKISNTQGVLAIRDTTAGADRFVINDNGTGYFLSNFQIGSTTSSPGATLHVKTSYPSLKVDSGGHASDAYVRIISGNAQNSRLEFGDSDDDDIGMIDYDHANNSMSFLTSTSERLRIHSNGAVSIANTRNYYGALNVEKNAAGSTAIDIKASGAGSYASAITFGDHNTISGKIAVKNSSDIFFGTTSNHSLTFSVNNTEKMRLNLHGFLKCMGDMSSHMSADGNNYHEMQADNPHVQILNMKHGSSNGYGIMAQFNHGKSTHWAYRVYNYASGSNNMFIRTDGDCENINNSYGSTSDVKLKENIVDAKSQWNDIKALRVRNFNYKADESKTKMLGLVAQEAEQVCPSLVKDQPDLGEENEDLGTTTKFMKYSIVYMKAIKALQEAQERIEKLEQDNIALRARVTNLEGN